ncbi:hypothetical protein FEM48_Zijuj09G0212200 [Ziziphus jujuba var. spinosa]|uniref:At1g61320/AtMIF1 LRR domain-containing protein n=1 Tax=Ziziphus jujuba var. spinosa TaxID=714518 RepID=A0A978UVC4_ZIZJJ|nr:hypothetical protein FEM48_Zijuj09G0212200 [Ziziphus jujuba var. spinosa]
MDRVNSVVNQHVGEIDSFCVFLEKLIVPDSPKLVSLRVCGQSVALESLIITKCEKLKKVEICEVNLVTLYIEGDIETRNFILRDVPKLVHLSVHFNKCDSNFTWLFSCCLSQLVTLTMVDFTRGNKYDEDGAYPTLPNLKHLSLSLCIDDEEDGGLSNLRLLIEAFPNLETLVLHAPNYYSDLENRPIVMAGKAPKCPPKFLKEVEIVEYSSEFGDFELVMYLIQNTVALEKIIINCKHDSRPRIEKNIEQLFEEEEIARSHAMSQLQREIPSTIEFVSLDSVCVSGKDIEYLFCNAPVLENLTVRDSPELGNKYDEDGAYPTLPNLKHLTLSLCIDDEEDGELDNTVALEKIVINCKYDNGPRTKNMEQLFDEEEVARRHAMSRLQKEIPSTIEFVC